MKGRRVFMIGALCLFWSLRADATWARRYEKLRAGRSIAVASLPDGGAVVLASGFVDALFRIDKRGDVVAARQLRSEPQVLASGRNGDIYIGSWLSVPNDEFRGVPWVARVSGDLSLRWARKLIVPDPGVRLQILGIAPARDGGVVLGGAVGETAYVLKLGPAGDLEWAKTIDPSDREQIFAVREVRDGGLICAGKSRGGPWLVKLDRRGNVEWHRAYPGAGHFKHLFEMDDGDVLALGSVGGKALVTKTGGDGTVRWHKVLVGLGEAWGGGTLWRGRNVLSGTDTLNRTVLVEIGSDGAVGWRKRIEHAPIARQFPEPQRLTTTTDGIYLAPSSNQGGLEGWVYALRVDADEPGGGTCLGDATEIAATDVRLPGDELSFDIRDLAVRVEGVDKVELTPVALTSTDLICEVAKQSPSVSVARQSSPVPAAKQSPPVSVAKTSAFRGGAEERERMIRYRELLVAKEYDKLDELAVTFRRDRTRQDPMWWEIVYFYDGILGDASTPEAEQLARVRAWVEARPKSTAARIALARELKNAAWRQRGYGYGDSVRAGDWERYHKLLNEAAEVLEPVATDAQNDSRYWSFLVSLAAETGEGDVRKIIRQAAAAGHHEPKLYQEVGHYLHPRWGGSGAAYRAFAEEAATLTKSTFGDGMYAWLAYQATFASTEQEYAEEYMFDWARMKRGFQDIIRLNPQWLPSYHRFAYTADRFGDRKTARALFQRSELDWYDGAELMWRQPGSYERARAWALAQPVEPFIESGPATIKASSWAPVSLRARAGDFEHWPAIVMQGEVTMGETSHRRVGFLVESNERVIAVTAIPPWHRRLDSEHAIRETWQRISRWWMSAPRSGATSAVTAIATPNPGGWQLGVAVTLERPQAVSGLHVLKQRSQPRNASTGRRFYVAGCRWKGSQCEQIVVEGAWFTETRSGEYRTFSIGLYEELDADSFAGAPVLDEDGYVIGVSWGPYGPTSSLYAQHLTADFLESVMPAASSRAPAADPPHDHD